MLGLNICQLNVNNWIIQYLQPQVRKEQPTESWTLIFILQRSHLKNKISEKTQLIAPNLGKPTKNGHRNSRITLLSLPEQYIFCVALLWGRWADVAGRADWAVVWTFISRNPWCVDGGWSLIAVKHRDHTESLALVDRHCWSLMAITMSTLQNK